MIILAQSKKSFILCFTFCGCVNNQHRGGGIETYEKCYPKWKELVNLIVTTFPLKHALWLELYARFYLQNNIEYSQARRLDKVNVLWRLLGHWEKNQRSYEIIGSYPVAEEQTFFTDAISTNEKIMFELGKLNVACTQGTFEHCYVQPRNPQRARSQAGRGGSNRTAPMQTDSNGSGSASGSGGSGNSSDNDRNEDESKLDTLKRYSRGRRFEEASRPKQKRSRNEEFGRRGNYGTNGRSGSGSSSSSRSRSSVSVNDYGKIINLRTHYTNRMLDYVDALWSDDWQRGPKLLFGDNDEDKYREKDENRKHSGGMSMSCCFCFGFACFCFVLLVLFVCTV